MTALWFRWNSKSCVLALAMLAAPLSVAAASADTIKIVAIGTSNTYGRYVQRGEDYPARLEAALKARGYDVRVINAGVNGDTVAAGLARLDSAVPPGTNIAIVEFGVNDRRNGVPPNVIQAGLDKIVDRLRQRKIEVMVANYMDVSGGGLARGTYYFPYDVSRFPMNLRIAEDPEHHLNAAGYELLVARMVPPVESLIKRVRENQREQERMR